MHGARERRVGYIWSRLIINRRCRDGIKFLDCGRTHVPCKILSMIRFLIVPISISQLLIYQRTLQQDYMPFSLSSSSKCSDDEIFKSLVIFINIKGEGCKLFPPPEIGVCLRSTGVDCSLNFGTYSRRINTKSDIANTRFLRRENISLCSRYHLRKACHLLGIIFPLITFDGIMLFYQNALTL